MSTPDPAAQTARDIIEASRYLVLATADATGRPWSSPVYFAHIGFTEFFWVSSPEVTHSRNIAVRPEVGRPARSPHPRTAHLTHMAKRTTQSRWYLPRWNASGGYGSRARA